MKVLILATDYPSYKNKASLHYIHARNLFYLKKSIDITVINFSAERDYEYEGISVITFDSYKNNMQTQQFDLLISHAPNLKSHFRFLVKYGEKFPKMVFFFHGHEVLMTRKVYPKPYYYKKNANPFLVFLRNNYDRFKLFIWRKYIPKISEKSHFIFVSEWMFDEFFKWTKINRTVIEGRYSITYNCVGPLYEKNDYDVASPKEYDFVTIRSILDGSKYCIDLVCEIAKNNPSYQFLIIGRGEFFNYFEMPKNIKWIDQHLSQTEIINMLNKSRCALMPTRTDAQGLMMCEMATFGIPLITSDIPVCYEVLGDFENVRFINNSNSRIKMNTLLDELTMNLPYEKNEKYFNENTSSKEINVFKQLLSEK